MAQSKIHVPSVKSLPHIPYAASGIKSCPKLVYCIWRSGRHAAIRIACDSWRCPDCGKIKMDRLTRNLADATFDQKVLHEIKTKDERIIENINRFLRAKKIPSLRLKLVGWTLTITSEACTGKTWASNPELRTNVIAKIHRLPLEIIKRRDFTLGWMPEPLYEPKRDVIAYSTVFSNIDSMRTTLAEYGVDLNQEFIEDPLDLAERMTQLRSDFELILEEVDDHMPLFLGGYEHD